MRFAFTEDQLAFRDAVHDLLERECPAAVVRDAWTSDSGGAAKAWLGLAQMGVLGLLADEPMGGLGLDEVDLVLVLEETGYAALPEPVVEHAAVAVPMLDAPLTAVSSDEIVTAPFHHDDVVPYADRADWFLMFRDDAFHLVARADVRLERRESVDGARRLALVEWEVARAERVAEGDAAGLAFDRGAMGTAAQLVGLTRRMVDMTVEYVKERQQFGAPIGSFQAVKHHLADARIGLEFARPLVYRAAWSVAHGDAERPVHVSMAKSTASDAATLAARKALQCHGAMGYSYEYDLHLYMKRAWALAAAWGDAPWHRGRVGRAIL